MRTSGAGRRHPVDNWPRPEPAGLSGWSEPRLFEPLRDQCPVAGDLDVPPPRFEPPGQHEQQFPCRRPDRRVGGVPAMPPADARRRPRHVPAPVGQTQLGHLESQRLARAGELAKRALVGTGTAWRWPRTSRTLRRRPPPVRGGRGGGRRVRRRSDGSPRRAASCGARTRRWCPAARSIQAVPARGRGWRRPVPGHRRQPVRPRRRVPRCVHDGVGRRVLVRPGDDPGRPAVPGPDMTDQIRHGPAGTGRHRGRRVEFAGDRSEPRGLRAELRRVSVERQPDHRLSLNRLSVPRSG